MSEIDQLLEFSKKVAVMVGDLLQENVGAVAREHTFSEAVPREMKAVIDRKLEDEILSQLQPLGYPILSEETGEVKGINDSGLRFIVDPLDGTVNFVRGLGPSAVSIALYSGDTPLFGVLSLFPSGDLVWGGKTLGAFYNDVPIQVSENAIPARSVLCTGIPSSFSFDDQKGVSDFVDLLATFSKVRMLGAASISLLSVAKGTAEAYSETEIMLWDVAAGLAIVEGAGGTVVTKPGNKKHSFNVVSTNGKIDLQGLSK